MQDIQALVIYYKLLPSFSDGSGEETDDETEDDDDEEENEQT